MKGNLDEILNSLDPALARGIARHGVKLAIDLLQTLYADLTAEEAKPPGRIGRPPKTTTVARVATGRSGWSDDPEERKREMARRMAVAKAKKKGKFKSPAQTRWARMSRNERAAWKRSMQLGKEKHDRERAKTESAA